MDYMKIIEKLDITGDLTDEEFVFLIEMTDDVLCKELFEHADNKRKKIYGTDVYLRGLIEFTNYCKNDCYYCGIRNSNKKLERYRLSKEDILSCCKEGYELGYRTFVLQGGEDPFFTDEVMSDIVSSVHSRYSDCAITLSIGERSIDSYKRLFEAGARRYLLRHETANPGHYGLLHPEKMSLDNRKNCLFELKKIGYQVGSGFMVGSPYQTTSDLVCDLRFLQDLQPDMIGIGPYISHAQTPFVGKENGDVNLTLRMIAILRLMFPHALIPATTALATLNPMGRELGLKAGANVAMPNLSPVKTRKLYDLYDNKACTGEESAQCRECIEKRIEAAGYKVVVSIGDRI